MAALERSYSRREVTYTIHALSQGFKHGRLSRKEVLGVTEPDTPDKDRVRIQLTPGVWFCMGSKGRDECVHLIMKETCS